MSGIQKKDDICITVHRVVSNTMVITDIHQSSESLPSGSGNPEESDEGERGGGAGGGAASSAASTSDGAGALAVPGGVPACETLRAQQDGVLSDRAGVDSLLRSDACGKEGVTGTEVLA